MNFLEVAKAVEASLGALDQHVIIRIALADIEFATNDIVAGAGIPDDVNAFDVDFWTVVDREGKRDRVIRRVALAVRPRLRESVTLPGNVAGNPLHWLVDAARVVDVPGPHSDKSIERRSVNLRNVGNDG